MSHLGRMSVLYGRDGLPPWPAREQQTLEAAYKQALEIGERVLIVAVRRSPDDPGLTECHWAHAFREHRCSPSEFLGELHLLVRDLEDECRGPREVMRDEGDDP